MKKLFVILLLLTAFSVNAQWVQQYTGVTANLYDIEFLNRYTGWSVGASGTCLKTTNGGVNWVQMNHPVGTKPLIAVHVVDSNVVFIVGYFRTIIKTTDSGNSWVVIQNGPGGQGNSYNGLYFINKDTGWVSGALAWIYKTTNGGVTFDSTSIGTTYSLDMYFKDTNTGFVTSQGRIFKTTNGGGFWFAVLNTLDTRYFWKISFVGNQYGWIAGMNETGVFRTNNFGENWSLIYDSVKVKWMYGVCFVNKDTGFIGGMYNKLFKTTDGGYNWTRENTQTNLETFESIEFVNDTVGWICSTTGVILHTTTGGQTLTGIANQTENIAERFELYQNYPNPFNNQTKIGFEISKYSEVRIVVYDILGRQRDIILDGIYQPGKYEINYIPKDLSSGIYFYKMEISDEITKSRKLILKK